MKLSAEFWVTYGRVQPGALIMLTYERPAFVKSQLKDTLWVIVEITETNTAAMLAAEEVPHTVVDLLKYPELIVVHGGRPFPVGKSPTE